MKKVRAKKYLGQHFLNDKNIAQKIVESLMSGAGIVLEIGPGMGVLTQFLVNKPNIEFFAIDVDTESIDYLRQNFPELGNNLFEGDFLKLNINEYFKSKFSVIGNFPYNISSQILFKVLENKNQIPEVVGMFQKEVAERIASEPGNKSYGILSVLLQAYYDIEYLFTVDEHVFTPPPRVKSAVIRLTRNNVEKLDCNEKLFRTVVKTSFNQRRKTIRNSIKSLFKITIPDFQLLSKRPEQLSVNEFVELTNFVERSAQSD